MTTIQIRDEEGRILLLGEMNQTVRTAETVFYRPGDDVVMVIVRLEEEGGTGTSSGVLPPPIDPPLKARSADPTLGELVAMKREEQAAVYQELSGRKGLTEAPES
jgi:hypothetical protein